MNVLVAYCTRTGNTAKVARAIHESVASKGHRCDLVEVAQTGVAALSDYDLVFLGSACHATDLSRRVKKLLDELRASPPFALAGFVTHATALPDDDRWWPEMYDRWAGNCIRTFERVCDEKQIAFLGFFHCLGAPSGQISEFIHRVIIPNDDEFATYMDDVRTHPDAADLERARQFSLRILEAC